LSKPRREKKQTYWRLVARQFRRNKMAIVALAVLVLLALIAVGAPFIAEEKPIYMVTEGKTYWFPNIIDYDDLLYFRFDLWEPGEGERAVTPIVPYPPQQTNLRERLDAPNAEHWLGTDDTGRDVLSRLIWGTRVSMSIGLSRSGFRCSWASSSGRPRGITGDGWTARRSGSSKLFCVSRRSS